MPAYGFDHGKPREEILTNIVVLKWIGWFMVHKQKTNNKNKQKKRISHAEHYNKKKKKNSSEMENI